MSLGLPEICFAQTIDEGGSVESLFSGKSDEKQEMAGLGEYQAI